MTNSTTKIKKTGPIRSGAVSSVAIILVITVIFGKFFLDSTIKKSIEWSASYLHGAEVNIQSVQTRIFQGQIIIKGLAVTDKKKPENNIVQIAYAKFDLLMDAILRAKIVIEDASLEGISVNEKRSRPGKLYKQNENKNENTAIKDGAKDIAKVASKELEDNFLGNFASIASGDSAKDQLSSIKGNLKSEAKLKELEETLKLKEKEWEDKLKQFKSNDELKNLSKEIKTVKFDKKKPFKSLKKYSDLNKKVKQTIKKYKNDSKQLKNDINYFEKSIKDLKRLVKEDTNNLSNHFSLDGFDSKSLAKIIFMKLLQEKLGEHYKYALMAKEYLPSGKKNVEDSPGLTPKKRGQGKNIHFPITTSYPFFWWKRGDISVKNDLIVVSGSLRDFTSRPSHLNKVAKLDLAGSFPKDKIKSFTFSGSFDHRTENTVDLLHLSIDDLLIKGQKFISSPKLDFSLKEANSRWDIKTIVKNENINFDIKGLFQNSLYNINSDNKIIKELFSKSVTPINTISFNAKAQGEWGELDWNIRSSFADALSKNLKSEVRNKVNEVKDKYMNGIKEKLGLKTKELEDKYSKIKNKFDDQIEKEKKKAEELASKAIKNTTKKADPVKDKGKKKLKKLFKKFKF
jgi:uncharacterized protein (TIGR03545 family)